MSLHSAQARKAVSLAHGNGALLIIDATHSYAWAFVVAGLASLAGVFCWGVIIPKVRPLEWNLGSATEQGVSP